jgi:Uncharacterized conserved protein
MGAAGDGPGEFRDPTGIAVSHDKVFVADARNARIQIFSLQGEFLDFFPKAGDATMLGRPMNLDIQDDQLFIADYDLDAVLVFTLDGVFQHAFGAAGEAAGALNSPSGVAALPTGGALVVDFYGGRLQAFDETGAFTTAFAGARKFIYPSDIARRRDAGFVLAEGYAHRLHFVTPDGAIERSFGGFVGIRLPGMPFPGWFKTVSSVAIDLGGGSRRLIFTMGACKCSMSAAAFSPILARPICKSRLESLPGPMARSMSSTMAPVAFPCGAGQRRRARPRRFKRLSSRGDSVTRSLLEMRRAQC